MKQTRLLLLLVCGLLIIFGGLSFTKGQLEKSLPQKTSPKATGVDSRPSSIPKEPNLVADGNEETVFVAKVVDGDTIVLQDGRTLRYIGIDTPETVDPRKSVQCFGEEAAAKNRQLVEGKDVRLEKDVSEVDRYGRLLRYVYVGDLFVNDVLVREGYAYASAYPPDIKYQQQFMQAQLEATENKKGLWSVCEDSQLKVKGTNTTDMDCTDFPTQEQAQAFFISQGGPGKDPHRLDSDSDGVVCESLP